MSIRQQPVASIEATRRTPVQALLYRWPLAVVVAVLGAVLGYLHASTGPVTYTAESRVAVGAGDLTSSSVSGFPLAAEDLAANYARYVNDLMLTNPGAAAVSATPIPSSNVIRVLSVSDSAASARAAARQATDKLVTTVNSTAATNDAKQLAQYKKAVQAWGDVQQRLQNWQQRLQQLKAANAEAATIRDARANVLSLTQDEAVADTKKTALAEKYQETLTATTSGKLIIVQAAGLTGSDRDSRIQRFSLLGLVAGVLVALVLANLLERLRRPRRRLQPA